MYYYARCVETQLRRVRVCVSAVNVCVALNLITPPRRRRIIAHRVAHLNAVHTRARARRAFDEKTVAGTSVGRGNISLSFVTEIRFFGNFWGEEGRALLVKRHRERERKYFKYRWCFPRRRTPDVFQLQPTMRPQHPVR